ncbi:Cytochrome c-type biogenesis protein CcmG/DsbE, thiol:disulfide oxidoreductase [Candidatus Rhodobacter oscarellae]|uniref:Cytochrome c-type biogenesis protein CcmG/DsbE, thiol:disulfide oxidoreductase n=1 Tax=Candidatus Rhodobacter oscarellae TaxID=1675527 RepID=A0A0J9E2C3_9RHOB|nr:DsbE family thiol:disulfide interchange protein [Candidatus Rhodobacter lobularis]KMW57011.1 Cytochrome c-type biogenesis protein CcmG/DsbE, thiol:disulfide oxidoreductase [Candidatus Rhodobacter lobularis]
MPVKPLMLLPPLVFAGLALAFYVGMQRTHPDELPSAFIGKPAPAVTEAALPGVPGVSAEALAAGEVRLVNFFASWCPPCHAEHPRLMALQAEGLAIAGINMRDQEDDALGFLTKDGNPYAGVAFDPRGRTSIDWGVTAPPETFIIGKDGKVAFRFIGPLVGTDYEKRFLPALRRVLDE